MDPTKPHQRLSGITTLWSSVCQAVRGPGALAGAQERLLERYGGAVRRYLRAAVRDPEATEDLFQEFALRFVQGGLRGADPGRGRFRDFVKGVLAHLIADYHQRRRKRLPQLPPEHPEPAAPPLAPFDAEALLVTSWREELLARSWAALAQTERRTGRPYFTVLDLRAKQPRLPSPQMAEQLGARLGKRFRAAGIRQLLHRAREHFADALIDEVLHTLDQPTLDQLEQELIELGLLEYCKPRLGRRRGT